MVLLFYFLNKEKFPHIWINNIIIRTVSTIKVFHKPSLFIRFEWFDWISLVDSKRIYSVAFNGEVLPHWAAHSAGAYLRVLTLGHTCWPHVTLVPCDFDILPLHSDQWRRYRQIKVGSLLVSPRLFVRQICYERLQRNRLDATINARFPRDVVQHAERNE